MTNIATQLDRQEVLETLARQLLRVRLRYSKVLDQLREVEIGSHDERRWKLDREELRGAEYALTQALRSLGFSSSKVQAAVDKLREEGVK